MATKSAVKVCHEYDPWPVWNGYVCLNCGKQGKHANTTQEQDNG